MKRILFFAMAFLFLAACSKDGGSGGTGSGNNGGGNGGGGTGGGGNGGGSGGGTGGGTTYPSKFIAANNFYIVYNGQQKPSAFKTNDIDGNTNLRVTADDGGELKIVFHNMNNPTATQFNSDYVVSLDNTKIVPSTEAAFNAAASDTTGPHAHIFNPNGASITVGGTSYSQIITPLIKLQTSSDINNGIISETGTVLSTSTSFPLSEATAVITNPNNMHHVSQQKLKLQ